MKPDLDHYSRKGVVSDPPLNKREKLRYHILRNAYREMAVVAFFVNTFDLLGYSRQLKEQLFNELFMRFASDIQLAEYFIAVELNIWFDSATQHWVLRIIPYLKALGREDCEPHYLYSFDYKFSIDKNYAFTHALSELAVNDLFASKNNISSETWEGSKNGSSLDTKSLIDHLATLLLEDSVTINIGSEIIKVLFTDPDTGVTDEITSYRPKPLKN